MHCQQNTGAEKRQPRQIKPGVSGENRSVVSSPPKSSEAFRQFLHLRLISYRWVYAGQSSGQRRTLPRHRAAQSTRPHHPGRRSWRSRRARNGRSPARCPAAGQPKRRLLATKREASSLPWRGSPLGNHAARLAERCGLRAIYNPAPRDRGSGDKLRIKATQSIAAAVSRDRAFLRVMSQTERARISTPFSGSVATALIPGNDARSRATKDAASGRHASIMTTFGMTSLRHRSSVADRALWAGRESYPASSKA